MERFEPTVADRAPIDLNRIATWVRVVESGSMTKAARALGRPKSSVSRAVKQLEEELGTTLLQRTTRKLTLTRAGENYLGRAREALRVLDEAHTELLSADGVLRGTIRMTAPLDPSSRLGGIIARAVAEFVGRYPHVHVDMLFTGRRVDLIAERVDVAVRAGSLEDSALVARRVATDSLVLVASPAYVSQHGTPKRLAELSQHRAILYNLSQGARWKLIGPSATTSIAMRGPVTVDEMGFQLPLVEAGVGIAMLPLLIAEESLRAGRLVRVLPQYSGRGGAIQLVYPALQHVPKRVSMFRDLLYETLKRELARITR
jgi:DNA-binding transcriptional LysR family regulator